MIKSDKWIIEQAKKGMITPFESTSVNKRSDGKKAVSYGVSSYGYDIRCSNLFRMIYAPLEDGYPVDPIDPKDCPELGDEVQTTEECPSCVIPPHTVALTSSVERFKIPENVLVMSTGKSTYARCGLVANIVTIEPGWEGQLTIALCNTSNYPIKVYANEGIAQLVFFESDERCITSYADRAGKYQNQSGITFAKT